MVAPVLVVVAAATMRWRGVYGRYFGAPLVVSAVAGGEVEPDEKSKGWASWAVGGWATREPVLLPIEVAGN